MQRTSVDSGTIAKSINRDVNVMLELVETLKDKIGILEYDIKQLETENETLRKKMESHWCSCFTDVLDEKEKT